MPTELAIKRYAEWEAFMKDLRVAVVEDETGLFTYHFEHPGFGIDDAHRGSFATRESAITSAEAVKKLKWPEPQLNP